MTDRGFLTELRRGLERCAVRGARLLVGVSGGADSVALLRGLMQLSDQFSLALNVAHLNHGLRGADSDADAEWVRALCQSHGLPVQVGKVSDLERAGAGLEEAAREARHRFLDQTAAECGCLAIATAHTADDQIETILHHIFRGTGLSGLRGIPEVRQTATGNRLVRPMLSIRREQVENYLAEVGQDFRLDATNADTSLTRNWLRHKLLPDLRQQFGPGLDPSLLRLAEQAAEAEQTLFTLAERLLDQLLLDVQPDSVRMKTDLLVDQPIHLVCEVFRRLWQRQDWPRQAMGFAEWRRVAGVAMAPGDANLPGNIRIRHHHPGLLVLEKTNR